MKKKIVQTVRGAVSYYVVANINKDMLTFCVKFDDELSENEFLLPLNSVKKEQYDVIVITFCSGFEQGRQRGQWEKAKRVRKLFHALQYEVL